MAMVCKISQASCIWILKLSNCNVHYHRIYVNQAIWSYQLRADNHDEFTNYSVVLTAIL